MDEITLPKKTLDTFLIIVLIAVMVIAILTLLGPSMSNDSGEIIRSI